MLIEQLSVRVGLTVAFSILVTACAAPTHGGGGPWINITKDPPNAVVCAPGDSATIGTGGGSVRARAHAHELQVRANAVQAGQSVRFVLKDLGKPYVGVDVEHRGAQTSFNPPLVLRLSYDGCDVPDEAALQIYRWVRGGAGGGDWNPVASTVDPSTNTVSAELTTLSQYALGAG